MLVLHHIRTTQKPDVGFLNGFLLSGNEVLDPIAHTAVEFEFMPHR